jgi:hypothetical protein
MSGKRRCADVELIAYFAGGQTGRTRRDQETEDSEAQLVCERSEGASVHTSHIREMTE